MPQFAAIVPAAGSSTRYGKNKLLEVLDGLSVLHRAIRSLWNHEMCAGIYLATNDAAVLAHVRELSAAGHGQIHVCPGGATRAHSVWSALRQVPAGFGWVAVHDAARPLLSTELIDRTLAAAVDRGAAAVPALPVKLTIKQAIGPLPARVERTLPRGELWAMQTPQIMPREALLDAFERCPLPLEQVTDDAQLLELIGQEVWLVSGDERNLKITTPVDLKVAEALLRHNT